MNKCILKGFEPVVFSNSKILFLGTMPSEKSLKKMEYYGNPNNSFWKLVAQVFEIENLKTYEDKIACIENYNLALWDVLAHCERIGSLDSNIRNPIINNFEAFFDANSQIQHIFFTSKNAYNLYRKYVGNFYMKNYTILPSPSGAYAVMKFEEKLQHWKIIKDIHEKLTKK